MFSLFKSKPLLDAATVQWLFDCYAWALREFDARVFREETRLVLPNDRFFPGRVESIDGMANLIFDRVKAYAGVAHWPTRLVDGRQCPAQASAQLVIAGPLRGSRGVVPQAVEEGQRLQVPYDPLLVNNPEGMIASLSHQLAHYLATLATTPPPGGEQNWPQMTEVLAVFLGFGLMFANSAFNVRLPKCGSCAPQPVDRQSFLSQYDTTYALAIFCVLKGIPNREVLPHLKGSLRGFYKKAAKAVVADQAALARLQQLA
ncbi:MAG: hypothetical protein OQL21_07655 [Gammaproteobacteria bacterium]|nr:hypothetical protein [Gammaproteobacteria bacterium]